MSSDGLGFGAGTHSRPWLGSSELVARSP